jgi:hypothetical protein
MQDLPIKINNSAPGLEDVHTFNARVYDNALELAADVVAVTQQLNIRSASSLLSYLQVFPEPIANVLGWTLDELDVAYSDLVKVLRGHVSDDILTELSHPRVAFGAVRK